MCIAVPSSQLDVVDQLVDVVGERVLRVGALVQLGEHVALHLEDGRARARELQLRCRSPIPPCGRRGPRPAGWPGRRSRAARWRTPNGRPVGIVVEVGSARIAAVLVAEAAAARAGRRMPGRIDLPVGPQHRVGVVLFLGAGVDSGPGSRYRTHGPAVPLPGSTKLIAGRTGGDARQAEQEQSRCSR